MVSLVIDFTNVIFTVSLIALIILAEFCLYFLIKTFENSFRTCVEITTFSLWTNSLAIVDFSGSSIDYK